MSILRIELENEGVTADSRQEEYTNEKDFFRALVSICDDLNVEVPIWSSIEERSIARKGFARIKLDGGLDLKVTLLP